MREDNVWTLHLLERLDDLLGKFDFLTTSEVILEVQVDIV